MLKEIFFDNDKYKDYRIINSNSANHLNNLNKINIFIGQNNSGKSRFLRNVFSDNEFEFNFFQFDNNNISSLIKAKKDEIRQLLENYKLVDADSIGKDIDDVAKLVGKFKFNKTKDL